MNKHLPILAILGAFCLNGAAQTDTVPAQPLSVQDEILKDTKRIFTNGPGSVQAPEDSVMDLLRIFYEDQYRQFDDPEAPYFMFLTDKADLALGIGGKLMMRGWFDWNGSQDSPSFIPYDIAIPADPTQRHDLGASFNSTCIQFTLLGKRKSTRYMVYLQAGVKNKDIVLKKAYVRINDFTVGLANTTFQDADAIIDTAEGQGPNGQASKSQVLGRWMHGFKNGISLGAGIEFPSSDQSVDDATTAQCRDYIPDLAALVQYAWAGGDSHVRLSGLMRTMTYRNLITGTNHNVIGWGAQLSGMIKLFRPLTFYYTGLVGRGVGSYQGDLSEGAYDLVAVNNAPGKMVAPLCMGVTGGFRYQFSRKVYANIGFGEAHYYEKHHIAADEYKYGLYGVANVFWKITPRFMTGIEYCVGKRMNFDREHAGANRLDAMMSFSF